MHIFILYFTLQIQVVRNHPSYKRPTNGVVAIRDTTIPMNLALYLAESEQRTAAMITDVKIDGQLCRVALGVLVETLPNADPENVERVIQNLEMVSKKGLSSYLTRPTTDDILTTPSSSIVNPLFTPIPTTDSGPGFESLPGEEKESESEGMFRSFEPILERILDDTLMNMGVSLSWTKTPSYACNCKSPSLLWL